MAFRRRNKIRREHFSSNAVIKTKQQKLAKQLNLAKTLSVTVLAFILCWMPYGFVALLDPISSNALAQKVRFSVLVQNCVERLWIGSVKFAGAYWIVFDFHSFFPVVIISLKLFPFQWHVQLLRSLHDDRCFIFHFFSHYFRHTPFLFIPSFINFCSTQIEKVTSCCEMDILNKTSNTYIS